ncbi:MAG TPA: glycogen debranching protein GlgX [Xanthobacteraceae bacterium]|nr:glycogen debranching protein GlgX [Xanthobacteraceae bacterium]
MSTTSSWEDEKVPPTCATGASMICNSAATLTKSNSATALQSGARFANCGCGVPLPLGAWVLGEGVNFAIFSRHATSVELLLYDSPDDKAPSARVVLDPGAHRTGDIWHVWEKGVRPGQCYAYRVDGPYEPERGLRFNQNRLLIDPYARALTGVSSADFERARGYGPSSSTDDRSLTLPDNALYVAKAIVVEQDFDCCDRQLKRPWQETIIYETHVRGLTAHTSSGVKHPGTYGGVIEKLPYLKSLGVTAVEFLPLQEFNENELRRTNPETAQRLRNYWGYNTVGFFAPKESYSSRGAGEQVAEFKEMVRELHAAGIEVILDIALTHTAEGDERGPTLSFRGLENPIYYLVADGGRRYLDYSGCGNTLNCNHPVVREFILNCLRHWAIEMHVDGFRFDLAAILGRDESGNLVSNAPLLERIAEDPILRDVKLIAEAWDAGGAYLVGSFPGQRWSEWNGRYRDDVRRFWRGDPGMAAAFASRICGSADIYQRAGKEPLNSINFLTCHDGFTLTDLVRYERKHNEANREDNRDGTEANFSRNHGVEGESSDPGVCALRLRQMKNLVATLMLSRGVPMLLGGDEFGRTQHGNNNAYCQDNETSWYDWSLTDRNHELLRFVRALIAFRKAHPVLSREQFYTADEVSWFNPSGDYPDWSAPEPTLGCVIRDLEGPLAYLCLLVNAGEREVTFQVPSPAPGTHWRRVIDTAAAAPADIVASKEAEEIRTLRLTLPDHSLKVLMATAREIKS